MIFQILVAIEKRLSQGGCSGICRIGRHIVTSEQVLKTNAKVWTMGRRWGRKLMSSIYPDGTSIFHSIDNVKLGISAHCIPLPLRFSLPELNLNAFDYGYVFLGLIAKTTRSRYSYFTSVCLACFCRVRKKSAPSSVFIGFDSSSRSVCRTLSRRVLW